MNIRIAGWQISDQRELSIAKGRRSSVFGSFDTVLVLLHCITVYGIEGKDKSTVLEDPNFLALVARELADGCHINPERSVYNGLGTSHLHTAKALKHELAEGGFLDTTVHGIMGGAWLAQNLEELWKREVSRNALMNTVRLLDAHEEIIGLSGHLLAISRKNAAL